MEKGVDGVGENNRNIIGKENTLVVRLIVLLAQGKDTRFGQPPPALLEIVGLACRRYPPSPDFSLLSKNGGQKEKKKKFESTTVWVGPSPKIKRYHLCTIITYQSGRFVSLRKRLNLTQQMNRTVHIYGYIHRNNKIYTLARRTIPEAESA